MLLSKIQARCDTQHEFDTNFPAVNFGYQK